MINSYLMRNELIRVQVSNSLLVGFESFVQKISTFLHKKLKEKNVCTVSLKNNRINYGKVTFRKNY